MLAGSFKELAPGVWDSRRPAGSAPSSAAMRALYMK